MSATPNAALSRGSSQVAANPTLSMAQLKQAIAPLRQVYVYSTLFASLAGFLFGFDTGKLIPTPLTVRASC